MATCSYSFFSHILRHHVEHKDIILVCASTVLRASAAYATLSSGTAYTLMFQAAAENLSHLTRRCLIGSKNLKMDMHGWHSCCFAPLPQRCLYPRSNPVTIIFISKDSTGGEVPRRTITKLSIDKYTWQV